MWCAAMHCAFESHPLRQQRDKLSAYLFFCFVINFWGTVRAVPFLLLFSTNINLTEKVDFYIKLLLNI